MSLKKFYGLRETPEAPDKGRPTLGAGTGGVTQPVSQGPGGRLGRVFGQGPISNGVPQQLPTGGFAAGTSGPGGTPTSPGVPVDQGTVPTAWSDQTIPNERPNAGGTGQPPQGGASFSRAPNAPADDEPLPDLPLEHHSITGLFGLTERPVITVRSGKLSEIYRVNEMPRPAGSYGAPVMAMIKWAKDQGQRPFTARDLFRVWRQAGGQPGQGDDVKAYASFQTSVRQFIDQNGRGTPEQPLVVVQAGQRGRGGAAVYSWGAVRPSKTAAARPQPGATPFDDMELGPAGSADQSDATDEPTAQAADQDQSQDSPPGDEVEQEPEPVDQSTEDELDWVPEPSEDTQAGRAMIALQEADPEKLQDLLIAVQGSKTVLDAATKAVGMFGRGTVLGRHAIVVAKSSAANLDLPDPDEVL